MSRIGAAPIKVPGGVEVKIDGLDVTIKGKLGQMSRHVPATMKVALADGEITVARPNDEPEQRSLHGLTRTLLNNMVVGVSEGYSRSLDLIGTGYRAELRGKNLVIQAGFSHPVTVEPLGSNQFAVEGPSRVVVKGVDKELVGEQAARIRKIRKPNPYTGKGIKYDTEVVHRKAGKAGASGASK